MTTVYNTRAKVLTSVSFSGFLRFLYRKAAAAMLTFTKSIAWHWIATRLLIAGKNLFPGWFSGVRTAYQLFVVRKPLYNMDFTGRTAERTHCAWSARKKICE